MAIRTTAGVLCGCASVSTVAALVAAGIPTDLTWLSAVVAKKCRRTEPISRLALSTDCVILPTGQAQGLKWRGTTRIYSGQSDYEWCRHYTMTIA